MPRILIIDDEPAIRRSVRKILELSGHTVDEAAEGIVGIAMHAAHPYDVVITDLRMPDCDGLEVITAVRRVDQAVKIILISDGDDYDSCQDAELFGAVTLLPKPFTMKTLQSVVDSIGGKPAA